MITVITGLPRSGKTAYTVEKLLMPLVGKPQVAVDPDGNRVEIVRKIHTNINGLLLEHEKIDDANLLNWHEWATEGDLIVFDEVQKPWPLKATGSAKTKAIETLETHGHMGVDFIVMSQHPMLIEAALVRLGGRHLHVRKLGNTRYATVYEWDGVSRSLLYKNAFAKFPYRRSKAVEKMYRSSRLHTKQPRKLPALLFGVLFAGAALAYGVPSVKERLGERLNPPSAEERAARAAKSDPPGSQTGSAAPTPAQTAVAAPGALEAPPSLAVAGCAVTPTRCTCYDTAGGIVSVPEAQCRAGGVTAGLKLAGTPLDLSAFFPDASQRDESDPVQAHRDGRIVNAMRAGEPIH